MVLGRLRPSRYVFEATGSSTDLTERELQVLRLVSQGHDNQQIAVQGEQPGLRPNALALQLFVMDEDGSNVECIGHLNLGMALHPVVLKDGRVMFSSLESQGLRSHHLWGLWSINPDGTNWGPMVSAFGSAAAPPDSTHFQTQLSDGTIVAEEYYNQNNCGFGRLREVPADRPDGLRGVRPGLQARPAEPAAAPRPARRRPAACLQLPFSPYGIEALTPFACKGEWPADRRRSAGKKRLAARRQGHAPVRGAGQPPADGWSPGRSTATRVHQPAVDSGIYLIKGGKAIDEPGADAAHQERPEVQRAVAAGARAVQAHPRRRGAEDAARARERRQALEAPARRHAVRPRRHVELLQARELPERRREAGHRDRRRSPGDEGSDRPHAGSTRRSTGSTRAPTPACTRTTTSTPFASWRWNRRPTATERRPHVPQPRQRTAAHPGRDSAAQVRRRTASSRLDPDGNPDTSFLAKIPADVAFTFQTLDKHGMVLNMAQTWHQVRPGEIRNDCGGCHAHSQKPTDFKLTAAAKPDYAVVRPDAEDSAAHDEGERRERSKKWDAKDETGLRFEKRRRRTSSTSATSSRSSSGVASRATRGKARRSRRATSCSTTTRPVKAQNPAGLGFDVRARHLLPARGRRATGKFGPQAAAPARWAHCRTRVALRPHVPVAAQPARLEDLRRAPRRLAERRLPVRDGAGRPELAAAQGQAGRRTRRRTARSRHLDYTGSVMPPPEAVKAGKVKPLTDEDRLHAGALDRPGLPDRPRLRPDEPDQRAATAGCSTTSARR